MKSAVISASTFLYGRMLAWYPPDLSAEYREDMFQLLAENLEATWNREAWRGLARAWRAVAHDFAGIILPYRTARAAPVLLALLCSIVVYGAMLVAVAPKPHCLK